MTLDRSLPLQPHVRLYQTLRSAHLERAHRLGPATIVYQNKRYDFEDPLTVGLDIRRLGTMASAWRLLRSPVVTLEINEPLMLSSLKTSAAALVALALRRMAGKRRTSVVTYAIANSDPFADGASAQTGRLRRRARRLLARRVWSRVDRVVFGTSAARETYETVLGTVGLRSSALVIPALPEPFHRDERHHDRQKHHGGESGAPVQRNRRRVVFVGDFAERKGVPVLLEAWPAVREAYDDAELVVVGKGRLQPEVVAAVDGQLGIRALLDPERSQIHELLDSAAVLVLPSQPTPTWREQVGLPIVEGLSHGLTIVTTEQTGLAEWLGENGHYVVTDPRSVTQLSAALRTAIGAAQSPQRVLATLPQRDGRLAADDWLFSHTLTISDLARVFDG